MSPRAVETAAVADAPRRAAGGPRRVRGGFQDGATPSGCVAAWYGRDGPAWRTISVGPGPLGQPRGASCWFFRLWAEPAAKEPRRLWCAVPSSFFPCIFLWRHSAWVLTAIGRSGCLGVIPLHVFWSLFMSQEASYPCDELLDTAQLARRVVPTFAAQAREMHPTGRYVIVAQSFSGHGTCRGGGSVCSRLFSRLGAYLSQPGRGLGGRVLWTVLCPVPFIH